MLVTVDYYDIINGERQDLADQHLFENLVAKIAERQFAGLLASPPCSTFSRARGGGSGPQRLRGPNGPDRYGLRGLRPADKERVRLGTLLAQRAAAACSKCQDMGIPWINENPPETPGQTSLYGLDEWVELSGRDGVKRLVVPQCMYGADFLKETEFRGNIDIPDARRQCTHVKQWWRTPPTGEWYFGAHPQLRGKLRAVEEAR